VFDDRFYMYTSLYDELEREPKTVDIEGIRLNMTRLIEGIKGHVRQWIETYGRVLRKLARHSACA